jgi:hypothetical protein
VASKAAASRFAEKIITMMDSRGKALGLIKDIKTKLGSDLEGPNDEAIDKSLILEDIILIEARLDQRIQKSLKSLTAKDAGTTESVRRAMKDDFLFKRLQAQAVLLRIRHKVTDAVLARVPMKRRISRLKNSAVLFLFFHVKALPG